MTTSLFAKRIYPAVFGRRMFLHHQRYFGASAIFMARISDAIKQDHQELQEAHDNIIAAKDPEERIRWRNLFAWELARHTVAEELLVYPAFEKHLSDGKDLAAKDREEHLLMRKELQELQAMKADHPEFIPTLSNLWGNFRQHIQDEEHEDIAALEKAISADESDALVRSFQRTKMLTPTRGHPSLPSKPPFEDIEALFAAPLDRIRELFAQYPEEKPAM